MRAHSALREEEEGLPAGRKYRQRSPAMVIGLADHVWTWTEFLTRRVNQPLRGVTTWHCNWNRITRAAELTYVNCSSVRGIAR